MNETQDMIEALHLAEPTDDEKLQNARDLALKYLRSRSPVPKTILNILERSHSTPEKDKSNE